MGLRGHGQFLGSDWEPGALPPRRRLLGGRSGGADSGIWPELQGWNGAGMALCVTMSICV